MGIYTCRKCGKKFESAGLTDGICEECLRASLDKYHQVREFLWSHPGSTASEIANQCDCSVRDVMQWVKEDRFMLTDGSKVMLFCANCGAKIVSGIYCTACQAAINKGEINAAKSSRLQQRLNSMHGTTLDKHAADDGSMRFLNRSQKK